MTDLLLDTHVLIWAMLEPHRLSPAAAAALRTNSRWLVSAVSFVEMQYLIERQRIDPQAWPEAMRRITAAPAAVVVLPVDLPVATAVRTVPRPPVADMPDRIIAATAVAHGLPLVTADRKIQSVLGLTVVW